MHSYRTLHDLILVRVLEEDDSPSYYTNVIQKVTKRPRDPKPGNAAKYKNIWYLKKLKDEETAAAEVLAQELFRLILPRHPKSRLATDEKGHNPMFLLSKEIAGKFTNLDKPSLEELKRKFANRMYKGLGEILIMSLFVNEHDLKFGNLFVNEKNELIKIDGDLCFFGNKHRAITAADLNRLPDIKDYEAGNWLRFEDELNIFPRRLPQDPEFRREINATILKIILLPRDLLLKFICSYLPKGEQRDQFFNEIIDRQRQLKTAAIENESFRKYMLSAAAQHQLEQFTHSLQDFHPQGKMILAMGRCNNKAMRDKFVNVRSLVRAAQEKMQKAYAANQLFSRPAGKRKAETEEDEHGHKKAKGYAPSFWGKVVNYLGWGAEAQSLSSRGLSAGSRAAPAVHRV